MKKGIDVLGTGDCLHPQWLQQIKTLEQVDQGTYRLNDTYFILTAEIETNDNVHHLVFFPSIDMIHEFKQTINSNYKHTMNTQGRPSIDCTSEQLARHSKAVNAIIGPAHIMDALSGLYSKYETFYECYKKMTSYISFVELGLGTDTRDADKIQELHRLTFLTNSDTHNPHPIRLGREFTRFQVSTPTFLEIKNAINRTHGNKPLLNCGFPPEEGKYYESVCSNCQRRYSYNQAKKQTWKCICGHIIKQGVKDKIIEKAAYKKPQHPYHRPLYLSLLPLHEIITRAIDEQNPFTETVTEYYDDLIETFGNEIRVLLETPIQDIAKITIPTITESIQAFRNATVYFNSGGGGTYGSTTVQWEKEHLHVSLKNQVSLDDSM
jgi:uncharacterized protein (TIGR00375 family)